MRKIRGSGSGTARMELMNPWDMRTSRKAMQELAWWAAISPVISATRRSPGGPGAFIERQPEEVRALLRDLRSDDISDVANHVIAWMCAKG